jgi:hypothetical protein
LDDTVQWCSKSPIKERDSERSLINNVPHYSFTSGGIKEPRAKICPHAFNRHLL